MPGQLSAQYMLAIINTEGVAYLWTNQQPMTIQALRGKLKSMRFPSSKFVLRKVTMY